MTFENEFEKRTGRKMVTRFELRQIVFQDCSSKEGHEYYEKYLKQHGFVLETELSGDYGDIYKDYEGLILLNQGDRVDIDGGGFAQIDWKCFDIDKGIMNYVLANE